MSYTLIPIGTITTPYNILDECPNNVDDVSGPLCELVLEDDFVVGLTGLNVGDRIDIFYWLDGSVRQVSLEKPHGRHAGDTLLGTFCLRTPIRPNPIGLAKLTIVAIDANRVQVRGLDCLNGTPLIDIKPSLR